MSRVQVEIAGLAHNKASTSAYALILREIEGNRRLPIVIGAPEANAIATELDGVHPQRPMTHDLIKNIINALGASVKEVIINSLKEGTFFAVIVMEHSDLVIDSRPSDAIAVAVRFNVPIFVTDEIMNEAGFSPEDLEEDQDEEDGDAGMIEKTFGELVTPEEVSENLPMREQLLKALEQAIRIEDYEKAAKIRDELRRLDSES